MIDRRALLRGVVSTALAGGAAVHRESAAAPNNRLTVIVRSEAGHRAVDPRTGDIQPWNGPVPATPAAAQRPASPMPVPAAIVDAASDARVTWWVAAPDDEAFAYRLGAGDEAGWWWRRAAEHPVRLDLPADLDPAFSTGRVARWFHGATIDAAHLGSGTLRLLAVEIANGEIVLDHSLDRRLELAATAVSDGGEVVAHVQAGNTGIELWATDLRHAEAPLEVAFPIDTSPVAASAIELHVAVDGDWMIAAAGLAWSTPGQPPLVVVASAGPDEAVGTLVEGELIGIVPTNP